LIGKPIDNTLIYILSKEGELCPEGVSGEICISGAGLARGYLNREDLNVEKFLPNPFSKDPTSRIYWTGDMGKWVEGEIEFHGRKDGQVKIRGYRIELGEIERVLQHFEKIKEAVVLARADSRGEKQLVGYAVGEKGLDKEELFDYLRKNLPTYMIPGIWVWMENLPLTPNGKIDRKALPDPELKSTSPNIYTAPGNKTEKELAEIWQNILGVDRVGIHDNFFDLGGHSLMATRLIAAIRKRMKIEIGIKHLFSFPTISGLSAQLQLINRSWTLPPILKAYSKPDLLPLSYSQESLWFIDQLDGSIQYHLPKVLRLKGELDENALTQSLKNVVERHEILRTVIRSTDGRPWQKVMDPEDWKLITAEWRDDDKNSSEFQQYIESLISTPFDLANDYMFRAILIRLNPIHHVLVLVMHHIASDGWSIPILLKEIQTFYQAHLENKPVELDLPIQYADFALWQKNNLKGEFFDKKVKYWKDQLRDLTPLLLPADYPRAEVMSNKGAIHTFSIDNSLKEQLLWVGQQKGTTLFMTLLSAFKVVLFHFSNQEDICVGTASAGRQYGETENLIGFFINPLPIRTNVEREATFSALLNQVRSNSLEAFDHQEVPFEKIVAAVSSYRDITNNPLFQVMFVLQNLPEISTQGFDNLEISLEEIHQTTSKFDLTFIISETPQGLQGSVEYNTGLFLGQTMDHLVKMFLQTLQAIVLDPNKKIKELDFLTEGKDHLFPIQNFNPVPGFPEFEPVHGLIQKAAQKFGDKTAVFFHREKLSYSELNEKANQMAHYLIQKGLLPGQIVGIIMDRSIDMIVAVLGTLKAGGAYLPIDTDYPVGRVEFMLKDSASTMHITHQDYQNKFETGSIEIIWEDFKEEQANQSVASPSISIEPSGAAYIIYTSGSTGQPKGVVIEHGNLFNFLTTVCHTPGISHRDRFLAVSSVSFDIAILETLLPYVQGAQVFLLDKFQRKDPQIILETIERELITVMFATPTHWKMILDNGWEKSMPQFNMISGGEALANNLADKLLPLGKSLWNIYGPTETTVFSTIKEIKERGERITIGNPIPNTNIYILDETLKPLRIGRIGEIFISGSGVARGYLNQPELTEKNFLPDPFHPSGDRRMYKTGDRGKFLPNGEIIILGRKDHQVKLRGYRIELGEIEQALLQMDHVKESIVEVKEITRGNPHLVAYLLLSGEDQEKRIEMEGLDAELQSYQPTSKEYDTWKRGLALSLPSFMIPSDFVVMKKFPLTSSGKINRKLLPTPKSRQIGSRDKVYFAETPEEKLVSDIWCEALGISQVDITDNFFEIGGHSLIAVQVMTRLEKESGVKLPLSILFKYPTVQKLALVLNTKDGGLKEWDSLVPIKPFGNKPPFYIIHGGGLNVLPFYSIAKNMDPDQPVFGLQAKGLNGIEEPLKNIEDIASHYISEIVRQNPHGPYSLAGYSLGGIIAFEIAKQLKAAGKTVKELIMFDTYVFQTDPDKGWANNTLKMIKYNFHKRLFDLYMLWKYPLTLKKLKRDSLNRRLSKILLKLKVRQPKIETPIMKAIKNIEGIQKEAGIKYVLTYYEGPIHLLRAKIPTIYFHDPKYLGWKPYVKDIRIWDMEGEHTTMFSPPNDVKFAKVLQEILDSPTPNNSK
jgi:amino acid adenylation domain-containing protein